MNVEYDLRDNGNVLLVTCLLEDDPIDGRDEYHKLYAYTPRAVRLSHPTIPGLSFHVRVMQTLSSEPLEVQQAREQLRAAREHYQEMREKMKAKR